MQIPGPAWSRRPIAAEPQDSEAIPATPDEVFAADPNALVIDEGCSIEGRLVTDRPVLVLGDACGSIESSSTVRIAQHGSVQGDVRARTVVIVGAVVGNVSGRREVQLCATGKLHGDVLTSSFTIERGAFFQGRTRMESPQYTRA
jgi:cytoskeletal protein CcmA (bactofilin family)